MIYINEEQFGGLIKRIVLECLEQERNKFLEAKEEKFYTFSETCEKLRISRSTLTRMTKDGRINANHLTAHPRYSQSEIERVMGKMRPVMRPQSVKASNLY